MSDHVLDEPMTIREQLYEVTVPHKAHWSPWKTPEYIDWSPGQYRVIDTVIDDALKMLAQSKLIEPDATDDMRVRYLSRNVPVSMNNAPASYFRWANALFVKLVELDGESRRL